MSTFFRKGDKVRLLTIQELQRKCYNVNNNWGGLWVTEHHGSPQVHAYLQNEIYLLGYYGTVLNAGYNNFVEVDVQGFGMMRIPPVCLELAVPELEEENISDVVKIMLEEDEIDLVNVLDAKEDYVFNPFDNFFDDCEDFVDDEPQNRAERLADIYSDIVRVKIQLDDILDQINILLKEEE